MQVCTTMKIVHTPCFSACQIAFCACAQGVLFFLIRVKSEAYLEKSIEMDVSYWERFASAEKETHFMSLGENREKPAVARIKPSRDTWLERSVLYHWTTTSWIVPRMSNPKMSNPMSNARMSNRVISSTVPGESTNQKLETHDRCWTVW